MAAGVCSRADLETRTRDRRAAGAAPVSKPELVDAMRAAIFGGLSPARPASQPPRFAVGEMVRIRLCAPPGHTRLPRSTRGRPAEVVRIGNAYVFPDANAHGLGEQPQHVYSVRLKARDLWGADADANQSLYFDSWESYLEPAA